MKRIEQLDFGTAPTLDLAALAAGLAGDGVGLLAWRVGSDVVHVSSAACTLLELHPVQDEPMIRLHRDDLPSALIGVATAMELGSQEFDFRVWRSGAWHWVRGRVVVVAGPEGGDLIVSSVVDVSVAHEVEEALVDGDRWLRRGLAAAGVGVWEWRPSDGTVRVSDQFVAVTGACDDPSTLEELLACFVDAGQLERRLRLASGDPAPFELCCEGANAGPLVVRGQGHVAGGVCGSVGGTVFVAARDDALASALGATGARPPRAS